MNTNKLAKEALLGLGILIGIYLCVVPTEILTLSSQIFGATLIAAVIVFSFVEYAIKHGIKNASLTAVFMIFLTGILGSFVAVIYTYGYSLYVNNPNIVVQLNTIGEWYTETFLIFATLPCLLILWKYSDFTVSFKGLAEKEESP